MVKQQQTLLLLYLTLSVFVIGTLGQYPETKGFEAISDGWFCQSGNYENYKDREKASYGLVLTKDNYFSKCVLNTATSISSKLIAGCQIYDSEYNCLECDCDKGLSYDGRACLDNYNRVPYCSRYNQREECVECKYSYNENVKQKAEDTGITVAEINKFDYGLYKGKCYNNKVNSNIPNCMKYDDSKQIDQSDNNCTVCHYKSYWYTTESGNNYYTAPNLNPSFYKYRHFLFKTSSDSKYTCSGIPETYESDFNNLHYLVSRSGLSFQSEQQAAYKCKPGFIEVASYSDSINGFKNSTTQYQAPDDGCISPKTISNYMRNGCYKLNTKNESIYECTATTTYKNLTASGMTVQVYDASALTRVDKNNILCSQCQDAEYIMESSFRYCVKKTVTDCTAYKITDETTLATECTACASSKVLTSEKKCVAAIAYCLTYNTDGSECTKCQSMYTLSFDKKSCLLQETVSTKVLGTSVGAFGCSATADENYDNCKSCDDSLGFILYGPDNNKQCQCNGNSNYINNPQVPQICTRHESSNVKECRNLFMVDKTYNKNRFNCTGCMKSYDWQFCAGESTAIINNCAQFVPGTDNKWCGLCKSSDFAINDQGQCVEATVKDDIMNSGIKNCEQVEYYINELPDDPLVNCAKESGDGKCDQCIDGYGLNKNVVRSDEKYRTCVQNQTILDANCSKINPQNASECITCKPGYYLVADKTRCLQPDSPIGNCLTYDPATKCTSCAKYYGLKSSGTSCAKPANCIYANPQDGDKCMLCESGWVLNNDHKCYNYITVDNCAEYSTDKLTCLKCQAGYGFLEVNNYKQCKKLENCVTPLVDQLNKCSVCKDGYYSNDGVCTSGPVNNCEKYTDNANTCTKCKFGYYKKSDTECSAPTDTNCLDPKDATKCNQCKPLYYLDGNEACQKVDRKIVMNCLEYDTGSTIKALNCKKCQVGYTRVSATSCLTKEELTQKIGKCVEYSQTDYEKCTKCDDTSFLNSLQTLCDGTRTKTSFCKTYDLFADKCLECNENKDGKMYYLTGDNCIEQTDVAIKAGCVALLSSGQCGKCELGKQFDSSSNLCTDPTAVPDPETRTFCQERGADNTCIHCIPGYILTTGTCTISTKPKIDQCIDQKTNGDADKCDLCFNMDTHYIKVDGTTYSCETRGTEDKFTTYCKTKVPNAKQCSDCNFPYGLKADDKSCVVSTVNQCAQALSTDNTKCIQCNAEFQFSGNECKSKDDNTFYTITNCQIYSQTLCTSCADTYFLKTVDSTCSTTKPTNCETGDATDSTKCKQCKPKYYWDGDSCESTTSVLNCDYYTDAATCKTCETNFALKDNKCENKVTDCQTPVAGDPTTCDTCKPGWYQKDGGKICSQPQVLYIPRCQSYSGLMQCNKCWGNYGTAKSNTECKNDVKDALCVQVLQTDSTKCAKCVDYTYLKNGVCTKLTTTKPNCLEYKDDGQCSKCEQGYSLSTDTGTCTKIANCLENTGTTCTLCEPPYVLNAETGNCKAPFTMKDRVYQVDNYKMYKYCTLCSDGFKFNKKSFAIDGTGEQCVKDTPAYLADDACIAYDQYKICKQCKETYTLLKDIYNQTYCVDEKPSDYDLCDYYEPKTSYTQITPVCLICNNPTNVGLNPVTNKCEKIATEDEAKVQTIRYLNNFFWNRIMLQCKSTYVFDITQGKCIQKVDMANCLAIENNKCIQCNQDKDYGLIYVNEQFYCQENVVDTLPTKFCLSYDKVTTEGAKSTAVCNSCKYGYKKDNNNCKPQITGCLAYAWFQPKSEPNKWQCTKCEVKYRLNYQTGQCEDYTKQSTIIGCNLVNLNGDCLYCTGPYILQSGKCFLKIPSCRVQNEDTCTECLNGFVLNSDNKECVANQPGCAAYSSGKCTSCRQSCPNTKSKLKTFSDFNVWNWQYFGMDNNGRCQEGCVHFDNNNNCDRCANYADYDCTIQFAATDYYKLQLYYLNNNRCYRRKNFVKYCVTYDNKTDNCLECLFNYKGNFVKDSTTYIEKCTSCDNSTYQVTGDQACNLNTNECKCQSCKNPQKSYYDEPGQICRARTQLNCLEYNLKEDKCTSCPPYYLLSKDGKCNKDMHCYNWDNSNPASEQRVCNGCNVGQKEGEYRDENNKLWCINDDGTNKYRSYQTDWCATYANNTETAGEIVCRSCITEYGLKFYNLVNLQTSSGSQTYKIQCVPQILDVEITKKKKGCAQFANETENICQNPTRPSDRCPKINIDDFIKLDCQICHYFGKGEQYGLKYDSDKKVHYCVNNSESILGCKFYDETDITRCQTCWYEYQKVSAGSVDSSINFEEAVTKCEYVNTFCRNIGCLLLAANPDREWPKCKVCADNYDTNEGNKWCDLVNIDGVDGGGVPVQTDDGSGLDGGLTPLPTTPPKPKPTYGKFLSVGLEVLLLVALGLFAFLL